MKKFIRCFGLILVMFFAVTNVYATEVSMAGEDISDDGEYSSSRFLAGNVVTSDAIVDGISMLAGNEVLGNGKTTYGMYAGNIVVLNVSVEKDLFVGGNSIKIRDDAVIGRDLYIAGNTIKISADVTRDLRVGGSRIDSRGIKINGDAYLYGKTILMDKDTVISGKLTYTKDSKIEGLESAKVGSVKVVKDDSINIKFNPFVSVGEFISGFIGAFVVMLVLFYFIVNSKEKLDNVELDFKTILLDICSGLFVLIVVPVLAFIGLFTGFLIPLSVIALCLYGICIYLSSLIVYYIVGNKISNNLLGIDSKYLSLAIGILLVKLIKLIPYVGGIVTTIVILYGMGLICKYVRKRNK